MRTRAEYEEQCAKVEEDPSFSVEFGINNRCILNQLKYFHCVGTLLPDVMHDVLEGVLPYEMKIMLQRFIQDDKYFQLDDLNYKIENFELGYSETTNRPTPISHKTLTSSDNSLKQNGRSQLTSHSNTCLMYMKHRVIRCTHVHVNYYVQVYCS